MNESQIFAAASKLASPEERAAYLAQACSGDPQLRADVEALLRAQADDPGFLEHTPFSLAGTVDAPALAHSPGDVPAPDGHEAGVLLAGRYQLLEEIGAGGMGTVWTAQQQEPVRRLVAVKLIKAGLASEAVLARFEAERQALAQMDHPNIARVFDAGVTPHGHPFFVMERVEGVPITRYCDEHRLTPRQRMELFVPVCQAIQHAHQKGIIHRDVKPSNILVATYDDRPVVKVIDFGVAKATGQQLTQHTGFGSFVGTVEYVSPEQASFDQLDVDTRSDVYSLGVLLYELLAGSPPFSRKDLEKAGLLEMLRVIREQEPPRPSTRLSTADGLPALAANRGTEPKRLAALVRGEIDWIVMKSLEKDRDRRYETANGFAADVQRYLDDEPVLACPPSASYRFRKFAHRNRAALTAVSLVAAALLLGVSVSTWQAFRATRAEKETAKELRETEKQVTRAETNFNKSIEAVDQMLVELGHKDLDLVPRMEPVRRRVLERALKFFAWFLEEKGDDPRVRFEAGMAYWRVGTVRKLLGQHQLAEEAFGRGIELLAVVAEETGRPNHRGELARAHLARSLLFRLLGRGPEAEADNARSRDLLEALSAENPNHPDSRTQLATALLYWGVLHSDRGDVGEAEKACRRAVALQEALATQFPDDVDRQNVLAGALGSLAIVLAPTNRSQEAIDLYKRIIELAEQTRRRFPESQTMRENEFLANLELGTCLMQRGDGPEAEQALGRAILGAEVLAKEFPLTPQYREGLAGASNNLGLLLHKKDSLDDAARRFERSREIQKSLVEDFPKVPAHRHSLGDTLNNLALVRREQGKFDKARDLLQEAIEWQLTALRIDARSRAYRVSLSNHYVNLAVTLRLMKAPAQEVDAANEKAAAFGRRLADDYPQVADYQHAAGEALVTWADSLEVRGQLEQALLRLHDAVKYQQAARTLDRQHPEQSKGLAGAYRRLFEVLAQMKRYAEHEEATRQAIAFLERLIASDALTAQNRRVRADDLHLLGATLHNLALHHEQRKELAEQRQLLVRAIAHQEAAHLIFPDDAGFLQFLGNHYDALGAVLAASGEAKAALGLRRKKVGVLEKLVKHRDTPAFRSDLAAEQNNLAVALMKDGKELEEVRRLCEQAIGHQKAALKSKPDDEERRRFLGNHYKNLGDVQVKLGKRTEAAAAYRDCLGVWETLADDFPEDVQYRFDVGVVWLELAGQLDAGEQAAEQEKAYRRGLTILRRQVARYPKTYQPLTMLGHGLHQLAALRTGAGKLTEARELLREAITHQKAARDADPKAPDSRQRLFDHHLALARVQLDLKEHAEAARTAEELPRLEPNSSSAWTRAGELLTRCRDVAAKDSSLSDEERKAVVGRLAQRIEELGREAAKRRTQDETKKPRN